jgi:hypothetical protein
LALPACFTVDLSQSDRLTRHVRLATIAILLTGIWLAGCVHRPAGEQFDSVPAPTTNSLSLPALTNTPAGKPATETGAAARRSKPVTNRDNAASKLIVTPNPVLQGRVVSANATRRFVVLNFPIGHLPVLEQRLDVYRQGIKVGEVKVTGPQRDDHIVADITAGQVAPGDEVKAP